MNINLINYALIRLRGTYESEILEVQYQKSVLKTTDINNLDIIDTRLRYLKNQITEIEIEIEKVRRMT